MKINGMKISGNEVVVVETHGRASLTTEPESTILMKECNRFSHHTSLSIDSSLRYAPFGMTVGWGIIERMWGAVEPAQPTHRPPTSALPKKQLSFRALARNLLLGMSFLVYCETMGIVYLKSVPICVFNPCQSVDSLTPKI